MACTYLLLNLDGSKRVKFSGSLRFSPQDPVLRPKALNRQLKVIYRQSDTTATIGFATTIGVSYKNSVPLIYAPSVVLISTLSLPTL